MHDQPGKSEESLRWLRGHGEDITEELNNIKKEVESEANVEKTSKRM